MLHDLFFLGPNVGMTIQNPVTPYKFYKCSQYRDIENFFKDNIKLKLIIVIVPNQTDEMYGEYIILFISHSEYKSM